MVETTSFDEKIAEAYRAACRAELQALKPGNVHIHAEGHGMKVKDFEKSVEASTPYLAHREAGIGERILGGVKATQKAVSCNTNLGIILLAAPLIKAAQQTFDGEGLRASVKRVLAALGPEDAEMTYRAIRLAKPGGLGTVPRHDVAKAPDADLCQAMREAAGRDSIAGQYARDYVDIFTTGVPVLREALNNNKSEIEAIETLYLVFLSEIPDSHVARKFSVEKAEKLRQTADRLNKSLQNSACPPEERKKRLLAFDSTLKAKGINPGTSADLTVACLLACKLEDILAPSIS